MYRAVTLDEMWTSQECFEIRSDNFWGRLRVKKDERRNFLYYDVLVGKKGKNKSHNHMGFDLTGNMFFRAHRGKVDQITKDVNSSLYGKEPPKRKVFRKTEPEARVKFSVIAKGSAAESKITRFEINEFTN